MAMAALAATQATRLRRYRGRLKHQRLNDIEGAAKMDKKLAYSSVGVAHICTQDSVAGRSYLAKSYDIQITRSRMESNSMAWRSPEADRVLSDL